MSTLSESLEQSKLIYESQISELKIEKEDREEEANKAAKLISSHENLERRIKDKEKLI